jgi:hypothetical protein
VSAHPAFPLIVGLWFGALFGLGSMVMPAVVFEPAFGLLGAGTRAIIALVATIVGVIAGLALARKVVAAQHEARAPRRRSGSPARETPARRPISAHEELGRHPIGSPAEPARPPIAGRRRSLTVADEELPSEYLNYVPLPGGEHGWNPEAPAEDPAMTQGPFDSPARPAPAAPPGDELDLAGFAPDRLAAAVAPAQPPAGAQVFGGAPAEPPVSEPVASEPPAPEPYVPSLDTRKPRQFAAPAPFDPPVAAEPAPEPEPVAAQPTPQPAGGLEELGLVHLLDRLGRSLRNRPVAAPAEPPMPEAAQGETEPMPFAAPSFTHQPAVEAVTVPPPVVPAGLQVFMDPPGAPAPAPEPEPAPVPVAFAPDEPAVPVVPQALRPFAFDPLDDQDDDDEHDHDPGPFTLPLGSMAPRPFDSPAAAEPAPAEEAEDESDALTEAEDSYSSLLAMKNPFRPREEFVRIDEPEPSDEAIEPAVVFPGQEHRAADPEPVAEVAEPAARPFDAPHQPAPSTAPARAARAADPAETERALRSALANLQRMSGAA